MSDVLHLPLATAYILVALSINVGPQPADRSRLWWALALAGAETAVLYDLGSAFGVAVWGILMFLYAEQLGDAYRPELYRSAA